MTTQRKPKKDTQKHIIFYGKNHLCSYCGTKFNEDECPNCCSTQYETTPERLRWEQEQRELQRNQQHSKELAESAAQNTSQKLALMIPKIILIVYGSIWLLVFFSFLLRSCMVSQILRSLIYYQ